MTEELELYRTLAWSLFSLIAGVCLGLWLAMKMGGRVSNTEGGRRSLFAWARGDVQTPVATVHEHLHRLETVNGQPVDSLPASYSDGHRITFTIFDRAGSVRDVVYPAGTVMKFFKADTPTRTEARLNNNDYSLLLAIGLRYQWLNVEGNRYAWSYHMALRERRLRALDMMCDR